MLAKFHQNPRFWKISVNFYRNSTHRNSLNFSSNSISNLDKFLWGKLFLISSSFYQYFIWNIWSQLGLPFDQISLPFLKKLIQINAKSYCASERPISFSSQAGPRASARPRAHTPCSPAPLTGQIRLSATASPGTVPAHPSDVSLPSLFLPATRARRAAHVALERHARAAAECRPPVGVRPHGTPAPRGTPRPDPPFLPSPPSAALPPSRSLPAHSPVSTHL
jgi:hypothetical protein